MKHVFPLADASQFGWPGIKGLAFNSKEDFPRASAARIVVDGRHGRVKNKISDRIYLVLEGSGVFTIDNREFSVKAQDVVIVPRDTIYDYSGNMTLFLVHSPAYDAAADADFENLQGRG